jgi:hypothetical protein
VLALVRFIKLKENKIKALLLMEGKPVSFLYLVYAINLEEDCYGGFMKIVELDAAL